MELIMEEHNPELKLRVYISGGGCSGFQYGFTFDENQAEDDTAIEKGGVTLLVPANYSARLETGTVNGGIDIDFPVTVQGRVGRRLSTTLGEGGPTVRAVTTNGGVRVRRSGSAIR